MIVGTRVSGSHLTVGSVKPMMTTEDLYYKKNGGDVDPDITLSYINEKIERLLGHFQKDFEGGVSAENLGPKFGGYGSFLPMYKCPPSNLPHKMNQQRECNVAPSGDNVPSKDEKIKSFHGHYPKDIEGGVSAENLGSKFGGSNERHPSNLPHKMNQQRECNATPSRDNVPLEDEKNKGFLGHYPKDFQGGVSTENLGSKFGGSNKRRRSNLPHKMNQQRQCNAAPSRDNVPLKDEKIKSSLGHYPKNFEGGVSAENLGSKFGGSNKPRRSNLPHKMNQQRECNAAPSRDNVPLEDEKNKGFLGHYPKDFEGGVSAENLGSKFGGSNKRRRSNMPHKMNQQRERNAAPSQDNVPLEDEKNKGFLGHYPKDFEGGVSAENLGSKFGGSNKRRRSNLPHEMNQQRECNAAPSTDNVPLEDSQKSKAPPPERPKAIVCNTISSHNRKETSGSISARVDSCLPSTKVPNICRSKVEASSRLGSTMNNRSLKVRSDSTASKNAAIYRALGLDDSPSSSSETSPDVNEGKLPISKCPPDESVTKIIEATTSFPVPHEALISPLHDSLCELSRKEKRFRETKPNDTNLMKHNKSNMLKKRGEKAKISSVNQVSACTKKRKPEEKTISRVNCNQLKRKLGAPQVTESPILTVRDSQQENSHPASSRFRADD